MKLIVFRGTRNSKVLNIPHSPALPSLGLFLFVPCNSVI